MQPIEHVVVLMLENRSFDQMLGCLRAVHPSLEGIDPGAPRANPRPDGTPVPQRPWPPGFDPEVDPDPWHETPNVRAQLEGGNQGFVADYLGSHPGADPANVMNYFDLDHLPALHALGRHFTVCDHWFSSVPGPTWTNRFFVHSATSQGFVEMPHPPWDLNLHPYDQETIYDRLDAAGRSWRIYWSDFPLSLLLGRLRHLGVVRRHFRGFSKFEEDCRDAEGFPQYVFIEPDYLGGAQNDDHPPCPALRGEALIATVYNALRAHDALWRKTLLVVVFDEHGGFHDHVEPPPGTPPGDEGPDPEYAFDRLGVRVPALLVSPWVEAGVFSGALDHTSLLAYLDQIWGLEGPLTDRMRDAGSFASAIRGHGDAREDTPRRIDVAAPRAAPAAARAPTAFQGDVVEASRAVEAALVPDRPARARAAPLRSAEDAADLVRARMDNVERAARDLP